MSKSTPADLAIAFRSLPRRLREATSPDTDPAARATAATGVDTALGAAAIQMACASSAEAVAAAIEQRHTIDWVSSDLDALQSLARQAAAAIRALQNLSDNA
ncbi:unannotated protein [freshwater metagenome]|uniref:Unannotated protein n=1 Tax=freshwater metagenome TaxID=449393 RepID=A0A6J7F8Y7_9ZZZZ|nr:hypothetical protein [Actinomycetota bacterium]